MFAGKEGGSTSHREELGGPRNVPTPLFGEDVVFDLHDEVRMYRELLGTMPFAIYFKDTDAHFVDVNPFHADAIGRTLDEIVGLSDQDIYPEAEAELYRSADRRVIDDGAVISGLAETHSGFNGTVVQHDTWKLPVRNSDGDIVGMMGYAYDHATSSEAFEKLKRSELRYALAMRATSEGIWDYDVVNDSLTMSPRAAQLLHVPITAEPVAPSAIAKNLTEDDMELLRSGLRILIHDEQETFECEVEIAAGGIQRWLRVRYIRFTENNRVSRIIGSMADITAERERLAQLEFNAHHDALTGLGNRRELSRHLSSALLHASDGEEGSGNHHLSLLCLDLDSFKMINDSLGHQAGDKMLSVVADRLRDLVAKTAADCTIARIGGDEFAVAITGEDPRSVEQFAAVLVDNLKLCTVLSQVEVYPSASIGLVHATDQTSAAALLRDGDIALYRAKAGGKGRVMCFNVAMRQEAQDEMDAQMRIRRALDERSFSLVHQPIIRAGTRDVAGFEALLRLDSDDGKAILPAKFLDYLEKSDQIIEVGRWVIDQALSDLADWRKQFPERRDLSMSVNVSRRQFSDTGLFAVISELLDQYHIPPELLVLEITETAAFSDDVDLSVLADFRHAGGRVAMDDFGTGYSSLFALNELAVDILKLDRTFTARIGPEPIDPIVQATFDFVRSLDFTVVAEGVEDEYQAEWLERQGSHLLQGYAFARPMRFDAVVEYLAQHDALLVDRAA